MRRADLIFERPPQLAATMPPEVRGIARDEIRLLVNTPDGHTNVHFFDLAEFFQPGDLLVVNHSATIPASLPAWGNIGSFILNLSTDYGRGLWLAEPRWSAAKPGPLPLEPGERIQVAELKAQMVAPYPGIPDLWFVSIEGNVQKAMSRWGEPIHYGYLDQNFPLDYYQTIFATTPGSAEMPSAGYPFTQRVLDSLCRKGVEIAGIVLHTGVSSLEVEVDDVEEHPLYAEPYLVPAATAEAVNHAQREGRRVIAVGTTVVRALESAWDGEHVRASSGFTRLYVHPARGVHVVDGLISGLHDPVTSHLAMLYAIAGQEVIRSAYIEAIKEGYLWHEFGDSHLILMKPGNGSEINSGKRVFLPTVPLYDFAADPIL
jgi:S-adenosylmethionine:tRNA ribosyltransferase-isomerase